MSMDQPTRITLHRTKGWRMPPNTVKVDRSTRWGNPFTIKGGREAGVCGSDQHLAAVCVGAYRYWLSGSDQDWIGIDSDGSRAALLAAIPTLRGKNLACWCKPGEPCHADVLLELANR